MTVSTSSLCVAGAAPACSAPRVKVSILERVAMYAFSLKCIQCGDGVATEEVRPLCHGLQMLRIDTHPLPTQVIYLKPCWNGPLKKGVREDVCIYQATRYSDAPVSTPIGPASPHPMTSGPIDLGPEPLLGRHADMVSP